MIPQRMIIYALVISSLLGLLGCAGTRPIGAKLAFTPQVPTDPTVQQMSFTNTFNDEAHFVHAWVELSHVTGGQTLSWRWLDPHDQVYIESQPAIFGQEQQYYNRVQASHKIRIAGEPAAALPGQWTVQVFLGNRQVASQHFRIEGDTTPPKLTILHPRGLGTRAVQVQRVTPSVTMRGLAVDDRGVASLTINGQPVPFDVQGNFSHELFLVEGDNRFTIEARDAAQNRNRRELNVRYTPLITFSGRAWAVVIGIDRYQQEQVRDLDYAVADAQAIGALLKRQGFIVRTLYDEQATARMIRSLLGTTLPQQVGPEDRLLIFYAGHGQDRKLPRGGKMGYLLPHDAEVDDLHGTAIDMAEIRSLADVLPAKHILFLIDACYGGVVGTRGRGLEPERSLEERLRYLRQIMREPGRQLITAGGAGEQVIEGPKWGHSVFTYFLLRGLGEERLADLDSNGVIPTSELYTYLASRVWRESGERQRPRQWSLSSEEGEFAFVPLAGREQ